MTTSLITASLPLITESSMSAELTTAHDKYVEISAQAVHIALGLQPESLKQAEQVSQAMLWTFWL